MSDFCLNLYCICRPWHWLIDARTRAMALHSGPIWMRRRIVFATSFPLKWTSSRRFWRRRTFMRMEMRFCIMVSPVENWIRKSSSGPRTTNDWSTWWMTKFTPVTVARWRYFVDSRSPGVQGSCFWSSRTNLHSPLWHFILIAILSLRFSWKDML